MASKRSAIPISPGLYVVATPIGNLGDLSLRALAALEQATIIACEDTRVTAKLRAAFAIRTPMIAYHEHNAERVRPALIERLKRGETVALVSDAGTPLISDPGLRLVRAAQDSGVAVAAVPGASALLAALCVAGLPTDRFLFAGFLPPKQMARRRTLAELATVPATLVLFETPHRLIASLGDMAATLGDREAAICRELTKRYEEVRRGRLAGLAADYARTGPPRGEIVVVIGPPAGDAPETDTDADAIDDMLREALRTLGTREAAQMVARRTGWRRRAVYARALALVADGDERG